MYVGFCRQTLKHLIFLHASAVVPLLLKNLSLLKWKDARGQYQQFSLISKVGAKWRKFGMCIGFPDDKLDAWEKEFHSSEDRWKKVMEPWLLKTISCRYPTTWNGLSDMLEDVGYTEVARQLMAGVAAASTYSD